MEQNKSIGHFTPLNFGQTYPLERIGFLAHPSITVSVFVFLFVQVPFGLIL